MNTESRHLYIFSITLVAALGGLLFGYDTAVISGTTSAIDNFFIKPLISNPEKAIAVIGDYKSIVSLCFVMVVAILGGFLTKLYGQKKGGIWTGIVATVAALIWYREFWNSSEELTANMASAIKGFTISSALIGCIGGGALGGIVGQTLGRRKGLILASVLFAVSSVGSALPDLMNYFGLQDISSLIIYRILGGIGVGLASMLSPIYIAEIAPAPIRGRLVGFNQFAIIFGMLVVYFANYFIALQGDVQWLYSIGWRWMFASEIIPCILFFVLLFFVPESPRYLVYRGKIGQAKQIIDRLNPQEERKRELDSIRESLKEKKVPWNTFGMGVLLAGILISFFQQAIGINVVLYYAPEIFRSLGLGTDASLMQTIIVGAVNLLFTTIAIFTVDRFGRKPLMILGALGMCVCRILLSLIFYTSSNGMASLACMLAYTAFFALSWGPVAWVLLSEIFPNSIRGALSIAIAIQWLSNFAVSWTFPIMNENATLTALFHHGFSYFIYGVMGLFAAIYVWKFIPETKGKTLEDIEHLWRRHK